MLLLADIGLAATGTLISSIATMSSARDLLAPLILLPLLIPLVIAAAGAGEHLLAAGGPGYGASAHGWRCSASTILIFLLVGYADLRLPARGLSRDFEWPARSRA